MMLGAAVKGFGFPLSRQLTEGSSVHHREISPKYTHTRLWGTKEPQDPDRATPQSDLGTRAALRPL